MSASAARTKLPRTDRTVWRIAISRSWSGVIRGRSRIQLRDGRLALLVAAQFVIVLDASIVNMALPALSTDLALSDTELTWVVNAYVLTFGGFLLLGGRLGDIVGPRRMFTVGLITFGGASLIGGLAPSPGWLIGARAAQGLGGAVLSPAALSILTRLYPDGAARNRALGVWGAAGAAGAPAGAILGGTLTQSLGWASVLLVNVLICACALIAAARLLPPMLPLSAQRSFDFFGATAVTLGLAILVYAVVDGNRVGLDSTRTLMLVVASGCILVAFVAIERRAANPLLPFRLLTSGPVGGANVVALIAGMPLYGMAFCLTLYLQRELGYGPLLAGVAFLPFGAVAIVTARGAARMVTHVGFKPTILCGLVLLTLGLLALVAVPEDDGYTIPVLPSLVLLAAGATLLLVATSIAGLSGVPAGDAGVAGGLITTSQQFGGAVGLALTVAVYDAVTGATGSLDGLRAAFAADAALAACAALIALGCLSSRHSRAHARAARADTSTFALDA